MLPKKKHLLHVGLVGLMLTFLPWITSAQINITNGVQIYGSLSGVTVNMSNRCELQVTNSVNPLSGCTINLNSADAYLVLPGIKPLSVVSTYLGQVRVNGAAAVVDSNCRVVQYAMGAIVLPHAPSLQPLTVFSAPQFTGTSMALSQYTYYKGSLGVMYANISSFKLKRGYMATFAQNEIGNGASKCYIAQDGDMEVSVLPSNLDHNIRFVYVTPWRWTSKKSISGDPGLSQLNVQSWYNWNISANSTRDLEYVPIRQQRWWPSLGQDWQARGANTLLGYNEPDRPDQANIAVGDAIWSWPDLLGTGLRLGSPAPSDGGYSSWLYPFMAQADAADLRVDFVAVHYYRCTSPVSDPNAAANQIYNALKGIYDQTKRPIWVTEWNNGANWTGCGDPTYAQQQAAIAAIIDRLDNTPWVERYMLYNWVEDVRAVTTNGVLTSAGITYRDKQSPIGYVQALQDNGTRSFAQFSFETNTLDSSGYGNNGLAAGSPAFTAGHSGQAIVFDGTNTVVTLPPNIANNTGFTFAAWVNWAGGGNFQRIFDFGNSDTHYLFLTPSSGSNLRFAIKNGGSEQVVQASPLAQNSWQHVAVTLSGNTASLYVNGALAAQNTGISISPASFSPRVNRLGKSQFTADPLFKGLMDDVLITDYALSAAQIAALQTNTPPQFTSNAISRPSGTEEVPYTNSIAGTATDSDPGDTLTYSKATGPAWLNVAANGTISGTPTAADAGTNSFAVRVTDAAGQNAFALLTIHVIGTSASGIWTSDASANWSEGIRWSGSVVASGANQAANFSTINITQNRTVNLDSSRKIGTLQFGDTSGGQLWTLGATSNSVLTLDTGSAASPGIDVTTTTTISAPVAGVNGFTKTGVGTLILSGNNGLSGTVNIDRNSPSANDGITRLVGPSALGNASLIQIRNNNDGFSTLQLDGSSGSISVAADVSVTCRNSGVVSIQNLAGTNVFNGSIWLNVGGNSHTVQSDANTLIVFTGTNQYVGDLTGTRTNYFTGAGNHLQVGPILNSTNGAPISLTKSGTGTLILGNVNTYGNGSALTGGKLIVDGTLPAGNFAISSGTTLGGLGTINCAVTLPSGATLAPGDDSGIMLTNDSSGGINTNNNPSVGILTVNNNVTLQPGSITRIEINKTGGENDQLRVLGTLTYGGTLVVTNLSGTLWAGDSFHIFDAVSSSGAFSFTNLPVLPGGLVWQLDATSGLLRVAEPGTNGVPPGAPFALAATGGDTVVQLTWVQSPTADVITNRIYRSTIGIGGPFNLLASVPAKFSYSDTAVVNNTTYHYVVTAVSTNGESVWSGYASATPKAPQSYVTDADTLHLWHFNELTTPCVDSAAGGTNLTYMIGGATLGNASAASGFGNSISFGTLTTSNAVIFPSGSGSVGSVIPFTYAGTDGAFTYEAVAQIGFNPSGFVRNQPCQILNCDANNSGGGIRVLQFRLLPPGTTSGSSDSNITRIEFINGTTTVAIVPIPSTGSDAIVSNAWYHVAATYNGAANTSSNLLFYWTRMDSNPSAANCIYATNMTSDLPGTSTASTIVSIGNSARNPLGGTGPSVANFLGKLDEVRISRVARSATNFFFLQPTESVPQAPLALQAGAGIGQVALGWSSVPDATSYNVKRVATSGAAFQWLTNVTTTGFMDTGVAEDMTYYYVVSALNGAGESGNSLPVEVYLPLTSPPSMTNSVAGGMLTLSWPSDHTGWRLQMQTNSVATGLSTNWFDMPDSTSTNSMTLPVETINGSTFFRLTFP